MRSRRSRSRPGRVGRVAEADAAHPDAAGVDDGRAAGRAFHARDGGCRVRLGRLVGQVEDAAERDGGLLELAASVDEGRERREKESGVGLEGHVSAECQTAAEDEPPADVGERGDVERAHDGVCAVADVPEPCRGDRPLVRLCDVALGAAVQRRLAAHRLERAGLADRLDAEGGPLVVGVVGRGPPSVRHRAERGRDRSGDGYGHEGDESQAWLDQKQDRRDGDEVDALAHGGQRGVGAGVEHVPHVPEAVGDLTAPPRLENPARQMQHVVEEGQPGHVAHPRSSGKSGEAVEIACDALTGIRGDDADHDEPEQADVARWIDAVEQHGHQDGCDEPETAGDDGECPCAPQRGPFRAEQPRQAVQVGERSAESRGLGRHVSGRR